MVINLFNIADIILIAFVIIFMLYGLKCGFLKMVYNMASFVVALIIAWILYPVISDLFVAFGLDDAIANLVRTNYVEPKIADAEAALTLPTYLQSMVQSGQLSLTVAATKHLTMIIINIISFVIVLILSRIIIMIVGKLINVISKLPVIGFFNRILGLVLGSFESILILYVIMAIVFAISPLREKQEIKDFVNNSTITKSMYERNVLVELIKPTEFDNYLTEGFNE
ncbi:MAG: CvpA family protein [Oscillospiraceae bacterium]